MPARRTTHRSKTGKKLCAVRDAKGRFKDIQTYKRAPGMDIKRKCRLDAEGEKVNIVFPFSIFLGKKLR
jgi:hypothetical protein